MPKPSLLGSLIFGVLLTLFTFTLWAVKPSEQLAIDLEAIMEEDYNGPERLLLSEEDWKERLTPEQFDVLRNQGTERAFSGELWNNKREGLYLCAGCGLPLFSSEAKYTSGTGWPSFYEPLHEKNVELRVDYGWFMRRTEVVCARCEGHLGHVFNDGPPPTGQRWCMNSAALKFEPSNKNRS